MSDVNLVLNVGDSKYIKMACERITNRLFNERNLIMYPTAKMFEDVVNDIYRYAYSRGAEEAHHRTTKKDEAADHREMKENESAEHMLADVSYQLSELKTAFFAHMKHHEYLERADAQNRGENSE